MAEARLGAGRLDGAYAWKSLLDSGAKLAFGTDVPVESSNPFAGIAAAMTREDAAGQPFGGWMPAQRLGREQAWQAYTIGAAHAAFAEDRLGSLEPGKRADFLIVDQDILLATPAQIRTMTVMETWIAGRPVFVRKR